MTVYYFFVLGLSEPATPSELSLVDLTAPSKPIPDCDLSEAKLPSIFFLPSNELLIDLTAINLSPFPCADSSY